MRSLFFFLLLGILVPACGGSGSGADERLALPPVANPGGGGGGAGGGGGSGGNPVPPAVAFDAGAIDLGRPGAFPSDLVADGAGNLYTVDDAMIPCNVVLLRGDGSTATVAVTAADLIDHDGTRPATAPGAFGTGLFGAFTGDLELAFDRWLLVTVGAGNSASAVRLANLVVIDTQSARIVQTINLAWLLAGDVTVSHGATAPAIPQSLPVMCAFVPNPNGTSTGTVFVALSNGAGSSNGLGTFYPGTVQSWTADFGRPEPLAIDAQGIDPARQQTRTYVSAAYNPVGLTHHHAGNLVDYLVLTVAGASLLDQSFVAHPTTNAFLEFLDLDTGEWRDDYAIDLGRILPAPQRLAIRRDGRGAAFGLLTSQTYAAAYAVDLTGLDSNPVDTGLLRLLRTIELAPGGATTEGSDFLPGVGLTASGRTAVLSSFQSSALRVLALPDDIETGPVVADPAPFVGLSAAGPLGFGALVVPGNTAADVYFVANGNFDANFLPSRHGFLGTLTARDGLP